MTDPRSQILGAIRRSLRRGPRDAEAEETVRHRLDHHPRNLIPARTAVGPDGLVELFVAQATAVAATVERLSSPEEIPDAVLRFLAGHNLRPAARVAPAAVLDAVPWERTPTLDVTRGAASVDDLTSVTPALAGIAETGTLMLVSGPETPTGLNFLPDNHIVVLRRDQVVATYEDGWDRLRAAGAMPRTVNFITGPSRTADIEQQIQLGAHGPRRLHILLLDVQEG